jgi:hypothetical protein
MHSLRALVETLEPALWRVRGLEALAFQARLSVQEWGPVVQCPAGRLEPVRLSQAQPSAQGLARRLGWRLELVPLEGWPSRAMESQVRRVRELGPASGWTWREASLELASRAGCRRPGRGGRWSSRRRCGCPGC